MNSIRKKLTISILTIFVISFSLLGIINYWNAHTTIVTDVEQNLQYLAKSQAEELGLWLNTRKAEVDLLANSPIIINGDRDAIIKYLQKESQRNPLYLRFLVADTAGNTYYTNGTTANITDRPFFQQAMAGKAGVSDPVISKVDGKMVVVVTSPIKKDGKIVGVLGGTVTIDDLIKRVMEIKVGKSGYAVVHQSDGLVIIHRDKDLILKSNSLIDPNAPSSLKALTERMIKGTSEIAKYSYNNEEKYAAFTPIPGTTWSILLSVPVKETTERLNFLLWTSMTVGAVVLILTVIITSLLAKRIAAPIQELSTYADCIAQGDVSTKEIKIASKDEIGSLASSFSTMSKNLQSLIQQVANSSHQVSAATEQLTATSDQSAQAANQVANTITDVATETEEQLAKIKNTVTVVEQISASIQNAAATAACVANTTDKTAYAAKDGIKSIDAAINQMENIQKTVTNSAQVVARLGQRSQEIGQIINTISNIAGQTNLLALNAAIEAARAGEQGRGFAVVADEVRKLAEQAHDSAKQIAELISEIQVDTNQAVVSMGEGTQEVKLGSEVVSNAGKTFKEINNMVDEVASQINTIAMAVKEMAAGGEQIVASVHDINDISRNISDQTQTLAATTEEQSASAMEISDASQSLAKLAEQLQTSVQKFKGY